MEWSTVHIGDRVGLTDLAEDLVVDSSARTL
jgi:hypothetical protein